MKKRTTQPKNNKYYIRQVNGGYNGAIKGYPAVKGADVLCNCVGYANGRYNEIIGKKKCVYQLTCNAENFIEKAKALGLKVSKEPTLGGILVWQKGSLKKSDGAGHVAVVEEIISKNEILTSESGYGHFAFKNFHRKNTNGRWGIGAGYQYRGCIVNPAVKKPVRKAVNVGDMVKVRKGANVYGTTRNFADHVYHNKYKVIEIRGSRAVIADGKTVIGAVNRNDLIKS